MPNYVVVRVHIDRDVDLIIHHLMAIVCIDGLVQVKIGYLLNHLAAILLVLAPKYLLVDALLTQFGVDISPRGCWIEIKLQIPMVVLGSHSAHAPETIVVPLPGAIMVHLEMGHHNILIG